MTRSTSWVGLFLAAVWLPGSPAIAQNVVAVLSSDSPAYRKALAGFEESYGHSVRTFILSQGDIQLPDSTKVVVAFGGKAATYHYPDNTTLVYCLTPMSWVGPEQHPGRRVRVNVATRLEALLPKLKEIQPGLKRLTVFIVTRAEKINEYHREFIRQARANGIEAQIDYLSRADELPDHLRSIAGKTDAIWMPPDPLLVTPTSFSIVKEFARSNNTPLYAPMDGLVDKGATASFVGSFRESGRTAGRIAAQAEAGTLSDIAAVYMDHYELTVNLTAAAQSGLTIPPDVVKKADRVVP
jgi:putative ABC transport system substrate-binding protein